MQPDHFNLNDIHHEPSDAQLESLMNSVAAAARLKAAQAKEKMMQRLRLEIISAKQLDLNNERG